MRKQEYPQATSHPEGCIILLDPHANWKRQFLILFWKTRRGEGACLISGDKIFQRAESTAEMPHNSKLFALRFQPTFLLTTFFYRRR